MKPILIFSFAVGILFSLPCYSIDQQNQASPQSGKTDRWGLLKTIAQETAEDVLQATRDVAKGAAQGAQQGVQEAASKMTYELFGKLNTTLDQTKDYARKAKYICICAAISQIVILGLCGITAYNSFK